jgi:hypothetical protein
LSLNRTEGTLGTANFWLNTDRPPDDARVLWVGAGTKDTGFSLTKLTFQITHATDSDTNAERDYMIAQLAKYQVIADMKSYQSGRQLSTERVNHYITDGEVIVANSSGNLTQLHPLLKPLSGRDLMLDGFRAHRSGALFGTPIDIEA